MIAALDDVLKCEGIFKNPSMGELQTLLAALPDRDFRIQFDERAAYDPARLDVVNEICARAGGAASVRFYGHFSSTFDCADASRLTECRALFLDTHTPLGNVRAIATMPNLGVFGIDVFNGSHDEVLHFPSVRSVRELYIGENRKADWDLLPLRDFPALRKLNVVKQHKNIAVLGDIVGVQSLSIYSIPRKASLAFVSHMAGLKRLTIMQGSRETVDEAAHPGITELEVRWVQGLAQLDCGLFPRIETLTIEDQAKIAHLDLTRNPELRRVHIRNCKALLRLNVDGLENLNSLFVDRTAIEPESFVASSMPSRLTAADFWGYGSKRDAAIEALLRSRGYRSVYRDRVH